MAGCAGRRRPLRRRRGRSGRARERGVRERQPHRARSPWPRAATPPTATRSAGSSSSPGTEVEREYYVNDAGGAGAALRRVDPRPRPRRGAARGRLPGRLRGRAGARRSTARPRCRRRRAGPRGGRADPRAGAGDAGALPRAHGPLLLRARRCTTRCDRRVLGLLEEREHVYPPEGAVWLRTTDFGDDKDRVLMRSTGRAHLLRARTSPTTRTSCARGYDRVIDVWGADHHGYIRACGRPGRRSAAIPTGSRS